VYKTGLLRKTFEVDYPSINDIQRVLRANQTQFPDDKFFFVSDAKTFLKNIASQDSPPDAFYTIDVQEVVNRYNLWVEHMPTVKPFYAVKANHDKVITNTLAKLGCGFDCASEGEIRQMLGFGVNPENIIFAHTIKSIHALKYAEEKGVRKMTFDTLEELKKMRQYVPSGKYILRLKVDDSGSVLPLGSKFGACPEEVMEILDYAHKNQITIYGLSFHVGSNCFTAASYFSAFKNVKDLCAYVREKFGYSFKIIDIGGGWPGTDDGAFKKMAQDLKPLIDEIKNINCPHSRSKGGDVNHSECEDMQIIAEPGRFFSAPVMYTATKVLGKRSTVVNNEKKFAYYLADGVFGFYNVSLAHKYNNEILALEGWSFLPLEWRESDAKLYDSVLWGPTCDSVDRVGSNHKMPEMHCGEYLYSSNVGAYTVASTSHFNQITQPVCFYIVSGCGCDKA